MLKRQRSEESIDEDIDLQPPRQNRKLQYMEEITGAIGRIYDSFFINGNVNTLSRNMDYVQGYIGSKKKCEEVLEEHFSNYKARNEEKKDEIISSIVKLDEDRKSMQLEFTALEKELKDKYDNYLTDKKTIEADFTNMYKNLKID